MRRQKAFVISYNYFKPGTYVVPTSSRCVLANKNIPLLFKVVRCYEPLHANDCCLVFVEGHATGVDTEYLREATFKELSGENQLTLL